MRPRLQLALLSMLATTGCNAMNESNEVIFHVNSFRVPCVGVAPMSCLQIKRGDPTPGEWQLFYSNIEGFEFQAGYRYKLRVRETHLPPDEVPADASSIRYELIEVVDKSPEPNAAIHDIWMLEQLDGARTDSYDPASRREAPYIEFNITRSTFLGHDGCNPVDGSISITKAPELRVLRSPAADTAQVCGDGILQAQFHAALDRVAQWKRQGTRLMLLDDAGVEVLSFRKTD